MIVGLALMRWHFVSWRELQDGEALSELDRKHYGTQYRRRMQTSAMVALVGLIVALSARPPVANASSDRAWSTLS